MHVYDEENLFCRCQPVKLIITSLFASMSFVTPLDYSVVNVGVVDHQPAVMMCNEMRAVSRQGHSPVTPDLDFY